MFYKHHPRGNVEWTYFDNSETISGQWYLDEVKHFLTPDSLQDIKITTKALYKPQSLDYVLFKSGQYVKTFLDAADQDIDFHQVVHWTEDVVTRYHRKACSMDVFFGDMSSSVKFHVFDLQNRSERRKR